MLGSGWKGYVLGSRGSGMTQETKKKVSKSLSKSAGKQKDSFQTLVNDVRIFNAERQWRKFHTPKNLSMALSIEAAELMEHFRWDTPKESWEKARKTHAREIQLELADVMLLLASFANYLDLDLIQLAQEKLQLNRERYPKALSRGRAEKYTAYQR